MKLWKKNKNNRDKKINSVRKIHGWYHPESPAFSLMHSFILLLLLLLLLLLKLQKRKYFRKQNEMETEKAKKNGLVPRNKSFTRSGPASYRNRSRLSPLPNSDNRIFFASPCPDMHAPGEKKNPTPHNTPFGITKQKK
jgi:cytoskeletal protein RodZ